MNLFGEPTPPTDDCRGGGVRAMRNGVAGQALVLADLSIRGHEAGVMDGHDIDIVANINGTLRKFQVKSRMSDTSFGASASTVRTAGMGGFRPLNSYAGKIDGFAFVYLAKRAVYYVHPAAILAPQITIPSAHWGRQQCDMSFTELLKRWECM